MSNKSILFTQWCSNGLKIAMVASVVLLAQAASAEVCWKDSYGRGVGQIPDCGPNQERSGLLCYPKCRDGFKNLLGVCWQTCPNGYRDDVGFCRKPEYGRGVGYPWKFGDTAFSLEAARNRCNSENSRLQKRASPLFIRNALKVLNPRGCNICGPKAPVCPAGWKEFLGSCTKASYIVGPELGVCAPGMMMDAGLCYKTCGASMKGIGPVCWGQCPDGMTDCGAMCGQSASECLSSVASSAIAGAVAIGKIAAMVASAGASAGIGSGVTGVVQAVKEGATDKAKELSLAVWDSARAVKAVGQTVLNSLKANGLSPSDLLADSKGIVKGAIIFGDFQFKQVKTALGGDEGIKKLAAAGKAVSSGADLDSWLNFAASIDPTGLASFAMTFKKPICGK